MNRPSTSAVAAAAADIAVVVIFVVIGRGSHDENNALLGVIATAAPFLLALLASWLLVTRLGGDPVSVGSGVALWLGTWAGGLLLRWLLFHGGVAPGFIAVAGAFLFVGLVGWRGIARLARNRPEN